MEFDINNKSLESEFSFIDKQKEEQRLISKIIKEQQVIRESIDGRESLLFIKGADLEKTIPGFKIINIQGQYTPILKNEINNTAGIRGGFVSDNEYATRTLKVEYMLTADTSHELLESIGILVDFLGLDKMEVFLADERKFYFGQLTAFEEINTHTNIIISSFEITCDSPYKFSELKLIEGKAGDMNTILYIDKELENARVELLKYDIKREESSGRIVFGDGKKQEIIFISGGSFRVGDKLELNCNTGEFFYNNRHRPDMVGIESDVENFILETGASIGTGANTDIKIYYRERSL